MSNNKKQKEENYFDMFIESARYTCKAADMLLELVKNCDNVVQKAIDVHTVEHAADVHFHKIYDQLNRSFITPIEREDILYISQNIDNVTDYIEDIANRFVMFDIKQSRKEAIPFAELIVRSCLTTKDALIEFKNFKKSKTINEKLIKINHDEEEGDRYYLQTVRDLFITEQNALEIVKWREIYMLMEKCLDACEDIADLLEGVILKNS